MGAQAVEKLQVKGQGNVYKLQIPKALGVYVYPQLLIALHICSCHVPFSDKLCSLQYHSTGMMVKHNSARIRNIIFAVI